MGLLFLLGIAVSVSVTLLRPDLSRVDNLMVTGCITLALLLTALLARDEG